MGEGSGEVFLWTCVQEASAAAQRTHCPEHCAGRTDPHPPQSAPAVGQLAASSAREGGLAFVNKTMKLSAQHPAGPG